MFLPFCKDSFNGKFKLCIGGYFLDQNTAQVMGKAHRMGKIEKGYDANLVCMNEALEIEQVVTG
ncbi:hypothetical protein AH06_01080 [candidate division TM6 bacterium Zodletone_IIa]|nr:hypothetical protein AH06_01080 [candidate division TM6 bacterium Zodletone_IIa]